MVNSISSLCLLARLGKLILMQRIWNVFQRICRFYNGKRGSKNQCQEDNRPTILSPNAVKLNGDGISTTPLRCELTAPVPVAAPQAAPSAAPNAPGAAPTAVPKSSNANATSAASILLFAALLFV